MRETVTLWKFRVEGEAGSESDERIGAGPRWAGDRGGGEGDKAAVGAIFEREPDGMGRPYPKRTLNGGVGPMIQTSLNPNSSTGSGCTAR